MDYSDTLCQEKENTVGKALEWLERALLSNRNTYRHLLAADAFPSDRKVQIEGIIIEVT